jgi:cytochrome c
MKSVVRISAFAALAWSVFAGTANAAAPAAFAACGACHSVDGTAGMGPSLKGVYGRKAGSGEGFVYSAAMRKSGLTWDDKSFESFLADPQKTVPGNVMPFPGVADEKQRAEIIDYLKTVK